MNWCHASRQTKYLLLTRKLKFLGGNRKVLWHIVIGPWPILNSRPTHTHLLQWYLLPVGIHSVGKKYSSFHDWCIQYDFHKNYYYSYTRHKKLQYAGTYIIEIKSLIPNNITRCFTLEHNWISKNFAHQNSKLMLTVSRFMYPDSQSSLHKSF